MAPDSQSNGWTEHQALVEWRLKTNEEALTRIETTLVQIQTTLAGIEASSKRTITALNLAVPAVVSLIVLGGQFLLKWVLK